ncbi:DUF2794 domain-containing protein [Kaistia dalseonensis]|uniref:DUF2794 domain-containing protein n=1 Tax=Kaistia dalseonensis TaxID=410840 RepID=A0ABU0H3L1_9HYPH|nr:DUF2794 domain-containing protein [Kaistia dalseonensis]MCX5494303.1 DUF2794 domain-containing protein [Kaistia dalseonensis]MDQ0436884.1 hypothetical protein [Kaistia dalseonensis]
MSESGDPEISGGHATLVAFAANGASRPAPQIAFDRRELNEILRIYGRMVAAGEWRDYAIDHLHDKAVFSIFRRTSEVPLFRVEKDPSLARRQGAYAVIAAGGYIMKRGHDLRQVLTVLDKQLKIVES